jgi:hypothetical protein
VDDEVAGKWLMTNSDRPTAEALRVLRRTDELRVDAQNICCQHARFIVIQFPRDDARTIGERFARQSLPQLFEITVHAQWEVARLQCKQTVHRIGQPHLQALRTDERKRCSGPILLGAT